VSLFVSRSFIAIAEAEADTETRKECGCPKHGDSVFALAGRPEAQNQNDDRHGYADVGIPN
jgi:hypothetical protein